MLPLLFALTLAQHVAVTAPPLAPLASGFAFHYHPPSALDTRGCHSLECVYAVRIRRGQIAPRPAHVDGLASVQRCKRLGSIVIAWIKHRLYRLYVVDCSNPKHVAAQNARGLILETDWRIAAQGGWATYAGKHGDGHARAAILAFIHP